MEFLLLRTVSLRMDCRRTHCPREERHHRGSDGYFANNCKCTDPKDVAIVSTSWPAGNNIGKHAFKSNNIFVEVKARSSSNVLVRV